VNRLRGGPPNEASTSMANDPNAANSAACGSAITWSANAKTAGITIAARAALFSEARPGSLMTRRGSFIRCGHPPARPCCLLYPAHHPRSRGEWSAGFS
jgi:hypothetical protein